jgi:hypothetical protein
LNPFPAYWITSYMLQYPSPRPPSLLHTLRINSTGKTVRDKRNVHPNSSDVKGVVRRILPPMYTKRICTPSIAAIIKQNPGFWERPAKILSRSVRALKQLKTDANMKREKKAVSK